MSKKENPWLIKEHLNSHIESLANSCANSNIDTMFSNKCDNAPKSVETNHVVNKISIESLSKNCPDLTQEQLDNFCYHNQTCELICPPRNEEFTNLNKIINKTASINKIRSKKYSFSISNFIKQANSNLSNIPYDQINNSFTKRYNYLFPNKTNQVNTNDSIENLSNTPPSSTSSDTSDTPWLSIIFGIIMLIAIAGGGYYLYITLNKRKNPSTLQISSSSSSNNLNT